MVGERAAQINLRCPASLVVADLVYDPLVTDCSQCAERGLRTADGLGMLLHQQCEGSSFGSA